RRPEQVLALGEAALPPVAPEGGAVRNRRLPGTRMPLAVERIQPRRRDALDGDVAQRPDRDGADDRIRGQPLTGVERYVDPVSHVDPAHDGAEPQTLAQF